MRKAVRLILPILLIIFVTGGGYCTTAGGQYLALNPESFDMPRAVPRGTTSIANDVASTCGGAQIEKPIDETSYPTADKITMRPNATTPTSPVTDTSERSSMITTPSKAPLGTVLKTSPRTQSGTLTTTKSTVKSQKATDTSPTTTKRPESELTQVPVSDATLITTAMKNFKASYEEQVVELVNIERSKELLPPLTLNASLRASARLRSQEIIDVWGHTRPDGSAFYTSVTIAYCKVGENIAAGCTTPARVVQMWMGSPGHRANIMNPYYTMIGVGCYYDSAQPYRIYWAQIFATP